MRKIRSIIPSASRHDRPVTHPLTSEQISHASALWAENRSLGEIAEKVGCSVYQLEFLYRKLLPHLRRVDMTPLVEGREPTEIEYKPELNSNPDLYACGWKDRDSGRLIDGYWDGPNTLREMKLSLPPDTDPGIPVIVRLTDPPQVVAIWASDSLSWVVTAKKRAQK